MNERSSRSHAVVILTLSTINKCKGEKAVSQLFLCDLAGSENICKSQVQGDQLSEANNINRSLHQLSNVIAALNRKEAHIP